jgi:RNA polymerase sigma-70 factor, ECF subfamily
VTAPLLFFAHPFPKFSAKYQNTSRSPAVILFRKGIMSGQAIQGATILRQAKLSDAAATETAIGFLIAEHTPMVFRIAYSILRNHHDAEDAAQECFLKVLKLVQKSKTGLAQVRNTKTWLARVAWTTALDRRSGRSSVRDHEIVAEDSTIALGPEPLDMQRAMDRFPDDAIAPDQFLAEREMQRVLEKLIAGLPEELRQPLELSTVQELNSSEIAEVMGIPEGSVRTRLLRARRLLKEKLATLLEVKKHG